MTRISSSIDQLKSSYTVVVVGSGYGGGIAASRLARAGQRVCVLERGKEIRPGEYPSTLSEVAAQVQVDSEHEHQGDKTALFDIHMNRDVTALVGCGLGGTSLINANVSLETDPDVFTADHWPAVFREQPELMADFYKRARSMLDPTPYPQETRPLNKVAALKVSADAIGARFECPPINVNFVDKVNAFGVYQPACTNCGDCVSGCNYGAKNTTLMNYLPDAHNHGAEIFTEISVSYVERDGDLWRVYVQPLGGATPFATADGERRSIVADVVVLAAGTLGSTEILLRSRDNGLELSPALGSHFSGNGDVLGFGYDNNWKRPPSDTVKVADPSPSPSAPDTEWTPINGIGIGQNKVDRSKWPGPCIAGMIDLRNAPRVQDRLIIEEGVIPGAIAAAVVPGFFAGDVIGGNPLAFGPLEAKDRLLAAADLAEVIRTHPGSLASQAYAGTLNRSQTYLVMSHDHANGQLGLVDDRLRIEWPHAGNETVFKRDNDILRRVNAAVHGQSMPNPMWSGAMGKQLVTVHPVGGCRMADEWDHGVVNDRSQVFRSPSEVHDGLYVCDGAVLPGAVGVNPLLTISALAERSVELLAHDRGWTIDYTLAAEQIGHRPFSSPRPGRPSPPPPTGPIQYLGRVLSAFGRVLLTLGALLLTGLKKVVTPLIRHIVKWYIEHRPEKVAPSMSFTETMTGWYSDRYTDTEVPLWERISDPFEIAEARGKHANTEMDFELTIAMENLGVFNADPKHMATATGWVNCPVLDGAHMTVEGGTFQLLPPDPDHVDRWLMVYDLPLVRKDGSRLRFHGVKHLERAPGSDAWTDLTKLFVTVSDDDGAPIGRGVLRLDLQDFVRQGYTATMDSHAGWFSRIGWLDRALKLQFGGTFASNFGLTVIQAYGGLLSDLGNFDVTEDQNRLKRVAPPRTCPAPAPEEIVVSTSHGPGSGDPFELKLYHYPGGKKGPVILAPGFAITAASFATTTIDVNIVEFLHEHDYDVWLFAYSGSPDSGSSTRLFDLDDIAEYDWPAAVAAVGTATGKDPQIIAHCVASMTVLMSLLGGHLHGVRSVISSQTTVHPVVNWLNNLKADVGVAPLIRHANMPSLGIDFRDQISMVPLRPHEGTSVQQQGDRLVDAAMFMVPVPEGEACTNPVCHRVFSIFGPAWTHAQLNHDTHIALAEMTGAVSTGPFEQISDIVTRGFAVMADGTDAYLPNVGNLRLPIDFLAGRLNQIFLPETSERTYEWLVAHNGPEHYTRHVFADYAHMDIWFGRDAVSDIYPYVLECLERH